MENQTPSASTSAGLYAANQECETEGGAVLGAAHPFRSRQADSWTTERLQRLDRLELLQLHANAVRLGEPELAELCTQRLKALAPQRRPRASAARPRKGQTLIPRQDAFRARGVWSNGGRWSGIRTEDQTVVFALWASAIELRQGACRYLLWAPNVDGHRPWSDSRAGQERMEHCRIALQRGAAEGFLVYGQAMEGHLPEDRARSVEGTDPELLLRLGITQVGQEYWAVWGAARAPVL